jgi:hypothetical protein
MLTLDQGNNIVGNRHGGSLVCRRAHWRA